MKDETLRSELARLRAEQTQTRRDEVFGGLTASERSAYELKGDRIHELEQCLCAADGAIPDDSWGIDFDTGPTVV